VHTAAAAFGLSAILAASASLFSLIKWAGAAYLIYLGIQMLFRKSTEAHKNDGETAGTDLSAVYRQGLITNLLNPKVAMFFMAFLPQFVTPAQASNPLPYMFLGSVFITTGTLWCLFVAAVASAGSKVLRTKSGSLKTVHRLTGLLFVGLGIRLAIQEAR
jgi:threonine/homoserine/homoserine lactone efflux protein